MSSQDLFDTIPAFLPQNRKILVAASAALHSANSFTYSINVKIPHFLHWLPSWVIVARKLDLWPQVQGHLDLNSKISSRCTCGITLSWVIAFTKSMSPIRLIKQSAVKLVSSHLDQHVTDLLVTFSSCCIKGGAFVLALHQKVGVLPINCNTQILVLNSRQEVDPELMLLKPIFFWEHMWAT